MPVLPNKFIEFVQAKCGLTPNERHKLLETLGRINPNIKVARREKVDGKEYSKQIGKLLSIAEAVNYEKDCIVNRLSKHEKIFELLDDDEISELIVRLEVNDAVYPKRLAPSDIVNSIESAGEKLEALDIQRAKPRKIYSAREEMVLDVITYIKKHEAKRVAQRIAQRQRAYILSHTLEELEAEYAEWLRNLKGEPPPETEEERLIREEAERLLAEEVAAEEERIAAEEAARHFEDLPSVRTLLDDAAELILTNPDAAAAIIRQWIGNVTLIEAKS
jgi:hypothetical protein